MHLHRFALLAFLVALTPCAFAQSAQELSEEAKSMAGEWEISNGDRDRLCIVTLSPNPVPGGLKLQFAPTCAEAFEVTKEIGAWRLDKDGLHFVDSKGVSLIDLDELEKGIFEGLRAGEGRYFVQSLAEVHAEAKPEQLFGDWQVSRGTDETICTVNLLNKKAGENFALELKRGCGAIVKGFAPVSWRLDNGELVISSAKASWRFEEAGEIAWRRIPEGNEPLWLVRQVEVVPPEGGG